MSIWNKQCTRLINEKSMANMVSGNEVIADIHLLRDFPIRNLRVCHERLRPQFFIPRLLLERLVIHFSYIIICW